MGRGRGVGDKAAFVLSRNGGRWHAGCLRVWRGACRTGHQCAGRMRGPGSTQHDKRSSGRKDKATLCDSKFRPKGSRERGWLGRIEFEWEVFARPNTQCFLYFRAGSKAAAQTRSLREA